MHRLPEKIEGLPSTPFNSEILNFFQELSKELTGSSRTSERSADAIAFGYWLRPSNLLAMQNHFQSVQVITSTQRVPAGVVFHIAPSNVEVLFAYSWAVATLCGCVSNVRVSTKHTSFTEDLIGTIEKITTKCGLVPRWSFFSAPKDEIDTTAELARTCDSIVIWGGDQTVSNIRKLPRKPDSTEVVFPDRESISVINCAVFDRSTDDELLALASSLSRDIASFGQQACSSPKLLCWVGGTPSRQKRVWFFERLGALIGERGFSPTSSEVMARTSYVHRLAANEGSRVKLALFHSLQVLESVDGVVPRLNHPGCGLIIEQTLPSLSDLELFLKPGDQTISQFGYSPKEWALPISEWGTQAPKRIVPIGAALDFHFIWDGHDLIQEFTRGVSL